MLCLLQSEWIPSRVRIEQRRKEICHPRNFSCMALLYTAHIVKSWNIKQSIYRFSENPLFAETKRNPKQMWPWGIGLPVKAACYSHLK